MQRCMNARALVRALGTRSRTLIDAHSHGLTVRTHRMDPWTHGFRHSTYTHKHKRAWRLKPKHGRRIAS
eukprot:4444409-Alexandrium_andersonii.AAC.1